MKDMRLRVRYRRLHVGALIIRIGFWGDYSIIYPKTYWGIPGLPQGPFNGVLMALWPLTVGFLGIIEGSWGSRWETYITNWSLAMSL